MLFNFRDLGGIQTTTGKKVKPNRLLRAGQPVNLNPREIAHLKDHQLRTIVDLRTTHEAQTNPVTSIDGVDYVNIDIMQGGQHAADPTKWLKLFAKGVEQVDKEFTQTYIDFALASQGIQGYRQFLKICQQQKEGAILFHCAAGKDRTGLGAAFMLKLLGVSMEDIFTDYLETLTNQPVIAAQLSTKEMEEAIAKLPPDVQENTKSFFGVKPQLLQAVFDAIDREYGGFEGYLTQAMGLTTGEIEEMQSMYLE